LAEHPHTIELERNTLRLLCAERLETHRRNAICRTLRPERFLDPIHRVVFEEICALHAADAHRVRELLAARVTLRGFPDADLEAILGAPPPAQETLDEWMRCAELQAARRC